MDSMEQARILLENLGDYIDQPGLAPDAAGACTVEVEGFVFSFFAVPEHSVLLIQALVGEADDATLEHALSLNLLWNGTGGGIFGLNPDDDRLYLTYRLDLPVPEDAMPDGLRYIFPQLLGALRTVVDVRPDVSEGEDGEYVPERSGYLQA